MSNLQQKMQAIQRNKSKEHQEIDDATLDEMAYMVCRKPYNDKYSYYPPKLLAQIIPDCYKNIVFNADKFNSYNEETLFYLFYAFPCDELQIKAFRTLLERGFAYSKLYKNFVVMDDLKTIDNRKHNVVMFDPFIWNKVTREIVYDEKFVSSLERIKKNIF
ncbi:putative NOT transcription complex subunit VIP2 [Nosema granulosis]|uniref:NOT transcription complex subunit VIP2 n=1 Tax=Nosema granulosis TaxID=83296 RepID=A0A9P6H1E9_9MICR|nr:putative NOT transcription complex subunit VIP2 [Nosema granulosis]